MTNRLRSLALCVTILSLVACGESGYRLDQGDIPQGSIIRSEQLVTFGEGTMIASAKGEVVEGTASFTTKKVKEIEHLRVVDEQLQKVRITYLIDMRETDIKLGEKGEEESKRQALDGKTVIGELVSGVWQFSLETGEADEATQEALDGLADSFGLNMYPKRALQLGESWELDPTTVRKLMAADWLKADGQMHLTLESITEFEGERAALIRTSFELTGENAKGAKIETGGTGLIYHSLASGLDLKYADDGQLKVTGIERKNDLDVTVEMSGPSTTVTTRKLR